MNYILAAVGLLALASSTSANVLSVQDIMSQRPALDKWDGYTYDDFTRDYNKGVQSSQEYSKRKEIFEKNLEIIKAHNAKNASWWMTVTPFADMTEKEFAAQLGSVAPPQSVRESLKATSTNIMRSMAFAQVSQKENFPIAVNNFGYMTTVRSQGRCGSCWANAAAGAIEAQYNIKHPGSKLSASTQQLVSCVVDPQHCGGTGGCGGSTEAKAFEYLENETNGRITTEAVYPYTSGSGSVEKCRYSSSMPTAATITNHSMLPTNSQRVLLETAAGPNVFTVSVAASSWALYGGGIFSGCTDKKDYVTNHAVVFTGYSPDYYQITNSWGPTWGDKGNMYLKRRANDGVDRETCGINNEPWSGSACDGDTTPVVVCGECGILSESTVVNVL